MGNATPYTREDMVDARSNLESVANEEYDVGCSIFAAKVAVTAIDKMLAAQREDRTHRPTDDVDLPTAPCPWCHRRYIAADWGAHYNFLHDEEGCPFVPFDVIERWYSSTEPEQMALTLPEIVSLYITGTSTPSERAAEAKENE